jgi:hypothetical protein
MIRRRTFIEAGTALLTAAALRPRLSRATDEAARPRLPLPTPAQLAWQEAEVVAMLCTDPRICHQEHPCLRHRGYPRHASRADLLIRVLPRGVRPRPARQSRRLPSNSERPSRFCR